MATNVSNDTSLKSFSRSAVNLAIRLVRCPEKATVFSFVTGVPFSVNVLVSILVFFYRLLLAFFLPQTTLFVKINVVVVGRLCFGLPAPAQNLGSKTLYPFRVAATTTQVRYGRYLCLNFFPSMIQMIKRMIIKMNMKPTNNRHARAKTSRATKPNRSKVADRAKNCPTVVVRKYTAEAQRIRR